MVVFISWSGPRSKAVALAFNDWLRTVIQLVEPWLSESIGKGERWNHEIRAKLGTSRIGLLCLTSDNLTAPWLLFEAGAISKSLDAKPCTFLLDIKPTDVAFPLGQFQHTIFDREDVRKLVHDINNALALDKEKPVGADVLNAIFDKFWPDLESKLKEIPAAKPEAAAKPRDPNEKLDEVLEILRKLSRAQGSSAPQPFSLANPGGQLGIVGTGISSADIPWLPSSNENVLSRIMASGVGSPERTLGVIEAILEHEKLKGGYGNADVTPTPLPLSANPGAMVAPAAAPAAAPSATQRTEGKST